MPAMSPTIPPIERTDGLGPGRQAPRQAAGDGHHPAQRAAGGQHPEQSDADGEPARRRRLRQRLVDLAGEPARDADAVDVVGADVTTGRSRRCRRRTPAAARRTGTGAAPPRCRRRCRPTRGRARRCAARGRRRRGRGGGRGAPRPGAARWSPAGGPMPPRRTPVGRRLRSARARQGRRRPSRGSRAHLGAWRSARRAWTDERRRAPPTSTVVVIRYGPRRALTRRVLQPAVPHEGDADAVGSDRSAGDRLPGEQLHGGDPPRAAATGRDRHHRRRRRRVRDEGRRRQHRVRRVRRARPQLRRRGPLGPDRRVSRAWCPTRTSSRSRTGSSRTARRRSSSSSTRGPSRSAMRSSTPAASSRPTCGSPGSVVEEILAAVPDED